MKSLESIIEGGLYSLEDDIIDIPQEEVTSDEYKEVILDGINESATVEQFLMWSRNAQEHLRVVLSMTGESDSYRTLEAGTLKKIGQGIVNAVKTLITNFINFFKKTINYFRSIGIKKKCEFIEKNYKNVNKVEIDNKKFLDPDILIGVENMFKKYFNHDFSKMGSINENTSTTEEVTKFIKDNEDKLKENTTDGADAFRKYCKNKLWESYDFFTKDYQNTLGKMNSLSSKIYNAIKNSETTNPDIHKRVGELHKMYNLCIKCTGGWISITNYVYTKCNNNNNGNQDHRSTLTPTFFDAVANKNIRRIRIMMKDSLLIDHSFNEFSEMEYAARDMAGLYDTHDGQELNYDKTAWNDSYMNKLMVQIVGNFSHERVEHLKQIVQHLHP